ncbi:MAG: Ldh family oxidoreductase [Candidatus Rokubacteria bacterium]|nr:Ldh family oxidoreductase [Candidatus Rokubacteria bacterium]
MIDAALCGYEYSGLPKLLNVADHPRFKEPRHPMRAVKETSVSVLFDGGNQSGMLGMYYATRAVIERAQAHGIAAVGVDNIWFGVPIDVSELGHCLTQTRRLLSADRGRAAA